MQIKEYIDDNEDLQLVLINQTIANLLHSHSQFFPNQGNIIIHYLSFLLRCVSIFMEHM